MDTQDLNYISEQILSYLNEHKGEEFEIRDSEYSQVMSLDVCEYDCDYKRPNWLNDLYVSGRFTNFETDIFRVLEYFEFCLSVRNGTTKEIPITVRWNPLEDSNRIWNRGRNSLKRTAYFQKSGFINSKEGTIYVSNSNDYSDLEDGFKNLIIVDSNSSLQDITFQLGIYLYQEKLIKDQMILYPMFESIYKSIFKSRFSYLKLTSDEIEDIYNEREATLDIDIKNKIFGSLLERYCIPNRSMSYKIYLKSMLKRLRSQEYDTQSINPDLGNQVSYIKDSETKEKVELSLPKNQRKFKLVNNDEIYGVNRQSLHTLVHRNKLKIPKNASGKYDWEEAKKEIVEYKMKLDQKKKWCEQTEYLAVKLSEKRGITLDSAKRTIRRWRNKGKSLKEIATKMLDQINEL